MEYKSGRLLQLCLPVLLLSCEENVNRFIEVPILGISRCASCIVGRRGVWGDGGEGVVAATGDFCIFKRELERCFEDFGSEELGKRGCIQ